MTIKMNTIEKAIHVEDWPKARKLIKAELFNYPDDHWLLTRLGLTYYEQGQYKRALQYSEKALTIAPDCPLVLWEYAGTLEMLGRVSDAMSIYQRLIKKGVKRVAYGECGEGLAWAKGMICDCYYRLAHCYIKQKNPRAAMKSFKKHISMRGAGCRSIYPIREVRAEIKALNNTSQSAK
jgi:tetratricopeptide (TPR) repeat protein